jgi:Mg2+ and Co2+ transporter CorA
VNLGGMPGMDWPYAFHAMIGGMVALGLILWAIMRWTKWF